MFPHYDFLDDTGTSAELPSSAILDLEHCQISDIGKKKKKKQTNWLQIISWKQLYLTWDDQNIADEDKDPLGHMQEWKWMRTDFFRHFMMLRISGFLDAVCARFSKWSQKQGPLACKTQAEFRHELAKNLFISCPDSWSLNLQAQMQRDLRDLTMEVLATLDTTICSTLKTEGAAMKNYLWHECAGSDLNVVLIGADFGGMTTVK